MSCCLGDQGGLDGCGMDMYEGQGIGMKGFGGVT
jgi:hypothetical protein